MARGSPRNSRPKSSSASSAPATCATARADWGWGCSSPPALSSGMAAACGWSRRSARAAPSTSPYPSPRAADRPLEHFGQPQRLERLHQLFDILVAPHVADQEHIARVHDDHVVHANRGDELAVEAAVD